MTKITWKIPAVAMALFACSNGHGGFGDLTDPGSGSGGGSTTTASSAGSSGGSSAGSSSGGSSIVATMPPGNPTIPADAAVTTNGYDADIPDAELATPITLTMSPFSVPANSEVFKCQQFGNPWGHDVDIVKMDGYMDAGSHHFFLFNMNATTFRTQAAPIGDCPGQGIEFHPFPYLSQTKGHYIVTYPEANMGYPIVAANGLMMNAHYINTTTTPMSPTVSITIFPAKAGVVTTHVGSIFLNNTVFSVPKNTTTPTWYPKTETPITAEDYTIFTNWSHMHQYSTDFQASTNGTTFYDEKNWDEPTLITPENDPMKVLPLKMKAGSSITWQCLYTNPTSMDMPFGDYALKNVMCIYIGQYYPADTTSPTYPDIVSILN